MWFLQASRQIEMDIWIDCIRRAPQWYHGTPIIRADPADGVKLRKDTNSLKSSKKNQQAKGGSFRLSTYINMERV